MKNKKLTAWIIIAAAILAVAASLIICFTLGSSDKLNNNESSVAEETTVSVTTTATTSKQKKTTTKATTTTTASTSVSTTTTAVTTTTAPETNACSYGEILNNIFVNRKTPAGANLFDIDGNEFALSDIDSDGKEELVILCKNTSVAAMTCTVYDLSENEGTYEELSCYTDAEFYDNGIIISYFAHNQGLSGGFWPYSVYKYNKDSDKYEFEANVTAWDKSLYPKDFSENSYPEEADKSGSGFLYYVSKDSQISSEPMDKSEFDKWHDEIFGSAKKLSPEFKQISAEEILKIAPELRN